MVNNVTNFEDSNSCDIPKDADFDTEFNGIIY